MSTPKRATSGLIRRLAILCLALTALPILSSTAAAQYFGGRGYGRGGGFYNRGYGGFNGNRGFYNRGYGGYNGFGGGYNRGFGYSGYNRFYGGPTYSPFYGGVLSNGLGSPFVAPYAGYGGFN